MSYLFPKSKLPTGKTIYQSINGSRFLVDVTTSNAKKCMFWTPIFSLIFCRDHYVCQYFFSTGNIDFFNSIFSYRKIWEKLNYLFSLFIAN